eukprot:985002-Rhodomonas_salina.3
MPSWFQMLELVIRYRVMLAAVVRGWLASKEVLAWHEREMAVGIPSQLLELVWSQSRRHGMYSVNHMLLSDRCADSRVGSAIANNPAHVKGYPQHYNITSK